MKKEYSTPKMIIIGDMVNNTLGSSGNTSDGASQQAGANGQQTNSNSFNDRSFNNRNFNNDNFNREAITVLCIVRVNIHWTICQSTYILCIRIINNIRGS